MAARVLALEFSTLSEEGRQAALDRAYEDALWSPDGFISEDAVNMTMTVLRASGLFEGDYGWEDAVDMRFVEALHAAGK